MSWWLSRNGRSCIKRFLERKNINISIYMLKMMITCTSACNSHFTCSRRWCSMVGQHTYESGKDRDKGDKRTSVWSVLDLKMIHMVTWWLGLAQHHSGCGAAEIKRTQARETKVELGETKLDSKCPS